MTKTEENSLNVQLELAKDINANYKNILYHVGTRGKELFDLLAKRKLDEENKVVSFSKEDFEKMLDISRILMNEENYWKLGILAESSVPDNKIKIEILQKLSAK